MGPLWKSSGAVAHGGAIALALIRLPVSWSSLRGRTVSHRPLCAKAKHVVNDNIQPVPDWQRPQGPPQAPTGWMLSVGVGTGQPSNVKPHALPHLLRRKWHSTPPPLLPPHKQRVPDLSFPTPGLQSRRPLVVPDAPHSWMHWPSIQSQEPSCSSWKWKWGYICTSKPLPEVCGGNFTYRELYITPATAVTAYITSPIMSVRALRLGHEHQHPHSPELPLHKVWVTAPDLALVLWWIRGECEFKRPLLTQAESDDGGPGGRKWAEGKVTGQILHT